MAEDNRLNQITEGAGLQESRLNVEFIEFLRKWSTPVLMLLAVLAVGYFLWNKQKDARALRLDEAFEQLNRSTETTSPSPDALRRIAEDYKSVTGVSLLAKLAAADEYLRAVVRGVKPGAVLNAEGVAENPEDVLTEEDRERFLNEAETLYGDVHETASDRPALALHTLSALYGLASVAESRGDLEAAENVLSQAHSLSVKHGFAEHALRTQERIDALPSLATPVTLYRKAELPEIPALQPPSLEIPGTADPADQVVGPQVPEGEAPPPAGDPETSGEGQPETPPPGEGNTGEQSTEDGQTGSGGEASDDDGR